MTTYMSVQDITVAPIDHNGNVTLTITVGVDPAPDQRRIHFLLQEQQITKLRDEIAARLKAYVDTIAGDRRQ